MKDRVIAAVVALLFAGMSVAFGMGAAEVLRQHRQYLDYPRWAEGAGRLRLLEVRESFYRLRWRWSIACEYEFPADGREHVGREFDFHQPRFDRPEQAQRFVEDALGLGGRARWRRVSEDYGVVWRLEAPDVTLRVRYSPRDPALATLTDTPPTTGFFDWVGAGLLALLCIATSLGALALGRAALGRTRGAGEPA